MKRVKCGNFWTNADPLDQGDGFEWAGGLFASETSDLVLAIIYSPKRYASASSARRALKRFLATMNRDNSLPLAGTVK